MSSSGSSDRTMSSRVSDKPVLSSGSFFFGALARMIMLSTINGFISFHIDDGPPGLGATAKNIQLF